MGRRPRVSEPEPEDDVFVVQNFLAEARADDRVAFHRTVVKWILGFVAVFFLAWMIIWWSGSTVQYSAARVENRSKPTYRISGTITDARTHQPVPWAEISTDFQFGGAFFSTTTDVNGLYSLNTLAEPHDLVIKANGYLQGRIHVGKQWFAWMPHGTEKSDAELTPVE